MLRVGIRLRVLHQGSIGLGNYVGKCRRDFLGVPGQARIAHGLDRQLAGDMPGDVSAHSIRDREDAIFQSDHVRVFIAGAKQPHIGKAKGVQLHPRTVWADPACMQQGIRLAPKS